MTENYIQGHISENIVVNKFCLTCMTRALLIANNTIPTDQNELYFVSFDKFPNYSNYGVSKKLVLYLLNFPS